MDVRRADGQGLVGLTSDGMAEALKRRRRSGHVACDAAEESHVVEELDDVDCGTLANEQKF
jgi:hypothetical protein